MCKFVNAMLVSSLGICSRICANASTRSLSYLRVANVCRDSSVRTDIGRCKTHQLHGILILIDHKAPAELYQIILDKQTAIRSFERRQRCEVLDNCVEMSACACLFKCVCTQSPLL
jgi:hypothetical protein